MSATPSGNLTQLPTLTRSLISPTPPHSSLRFFRSTLFCLPAKFQHARLFVDLEEARLHKPLFLHFEKLQQLRRVTTIHTQGAPGFEAKDHLVPGPIAGAVGIYGPAPGKATRVGRLHRRDQRSSRASAPAGLDVGDH